MLVELVTVHRLSQHRILRQLVADDDQLEVVRAGAPRDRKRLDQPPDVLVRLDVADVEHERMIKLVPLPRQVHVDQVGRPQEPLVDGVVDHCHFLRRDVEEAQDVSLGCFRYRQNTVGLARRAPHRALGVDIRQFARQVLREHQVDAIVNRHHRPAADGRRQHIVRLMHHLHALAGERERNPVLLGDRIGRRRFGHHPEVAAQHLAGLLVVWTAQHDVLRRLIEARELDEDVADVGANTEIVQLPRVNGNAHRQSAIGLPVSFR